MAGKCIHRGTTRTNVCGLKLIVLLSLLDIISGALVVPLINTGIGGISPVGNPGLVGMTGAGYGPGMSSGMTPVGQALGGAFMPAVQQPSAVIVTGTTGTQQVAGRPNNGPVVAIDYKLLANLGNALGTTAAPAPPPDAAPPAEDPPAERSAEDPGLRSERPAA